MDARLPDAFCESVVSLLPTQEPPGRRGGRPAIPHAVVLKVIWFVLTVGCRWKDIPREFGCCGETARRRLKLWQELGVWQRVHLRLLSLLRQRGCLSGSVVLIDIPCPIGDAEKRIAQQYGFRDLSHSLEFFGICATCK